MTTLNWKTGFEIELLAPAGMSRRDLAAAIAKGAGGRVRRCFYPQSEPSLVPGTPVFENLILGFDAFDAAGTLIARCVDDLTIRADLNRKAPGRDGWYRIVSDDARLLRLIMEQCDPDADQASVMLPVAELFGTGLQNDEPGLFRLADAMNAPVAMAASLPGERERPCELITPPLSDNHNERLAALLAPAHHMGFTVPNEAAVHVHFDAVPLKRADVLARLVKVIDLHGESLRRLVGTNPNCIRLGPLPDGLVDLVQTAGFRDLDWDKACALVRDTGLTKYADFNLLNFIQDIPGKPTFEVRILPGSMDASVITGQAGLFEAILNWCVRAPDDASPSAGFGAFVRSLDLPHEDKDAWLARMPN